MWISQERTSADTIRALLHGNGRGVLGDAMTEEAGHRGDVGWCRMRPWSEWWNLAESDGVASLLQPVIHVIEHDGFAWTRSRSTLTLTEKTTSSAGR